MSGIARILGHVFVPASPPMGYGRGVAARYGESDRIDTRCYGCRI